MSARPESTPKAGDAGEECLRRGKQRCFRSRCGTMASAKVADPIRTSIPDGFQSLSCNTNNRFGAQRPEGCPSQPESMSSFQHRGARLIESRWLAPGSHSRTRYESNPRYVFVRGHTTASTLRLCRRLHRGERFIAAFGSTNSNRGSVQLH